MSRPTRVNGPVPLISAAARARCSTTPASPRRRSLSSLSRSKASGRAESSGTRSPRVSVQLTTTLLAKRSLALRMNNVSDARMSRLLVQPGHSGTLSTLIRTRLSKRLSQRCTTSRSLKPRMPIFTSDLRLCMQRSSPVDVVAAVCRVLGVQELTGSLPLCTCMIREGHQNQVQK